MRIFTEYKPLTIVKEGNEDNNPGKNFCGRRNFFSEGMAEASRTGGRAIMGACQISAYVK